MASRLSLGIRAGVPALYAFLAACAPAPEPGCRPEGSHFLLATADRLAGVGALATASLDGACVDDAVSTVSADPLVRSLGDLAVAADRTGGDAIRVFRAGSYERPIAEFSVGRGSNVHDVARSGDRLLIAPYDEPAVVVTDLSGRRLGRIDLAGHADADGLPELDRVVEAGGRLHAVLQRLDRAQSPWGIAGPGLLVPLDAEALDAGAPSEVCANPKALPDPSDADAITLACGRFFAADGEAWRWSAGQPSTVLASESELGFDLTHVLPVGEGHVLVGIDLEYGGPSHLACLDGGGSLVRATLDGWLVDGVSDGSRAWLALRQSWNDAGRGALLEVDPATCAVETLADAFLLDPYGLALIP